MTPSPFTVAALELTPLGYHCLPLLPPGHDSDGRGKAPGVYRSGRWAHMSEWERFRDRPATDFEMRLWTQNWPEANCGILLGSPAGPGLAYVLIGVDVDTRDPDEYDAIIRALPHSPMSKKGDKGLTLFFAAPAEIKSRGYKVGPRGKQRTLMDLLTGNQTRQTVVPPSVHPDGPTYVWVSGPVAAADLPVFTEDDLSVLEETLESLGWGEVEGVVQDDTPRALVPRDPDAEPNVWRDLNDEALARLSDWVPDLDLYGLKPVRRGGYEAVATWRGSSTGQATEKRKLNLKIHPTGIRDMGDDRSYTALDLIQAATNWDLDDAFRWLGEHLGRAPPLPLPFAEVVAAERQVIAAISDETAGSASRSGSMIPSMTPPGLVGDIAAWICATSQRPQPILALGAALTIVGTAAGRQFAGPTRTGTQLYVLALARTGAGKDHPLDCVGRILRAAGLDQHVGPGEFMSMPAAIKFIGRSPLSVCPMDEFGAFLKRINSRKASGFEGAISKVLRTAWGSSFKALTTPEWASLESRTIFAPCLSLYGASTPEEFYAALEDGDTSNGLLNRFLVLESRERPRQRAERADPDAVPPEIIERLRALYYARGELFAASLNQADQDRAPAIVPWEDDEAKRVYDAFADQVEDGEGVEGDLRARALEMAQRIATICALGRAGASARVTADDMAWGRDVALWSADQVIAGVRDHLSTNEFQSSCKAVERLFRGAPSGTLGRSDLVRKLQHKMKAQDLENVVRSLLEGGSIEELQTDKTGGPGRTARVYRLIAA